MKSNFTFTFLILCLLLINQDLRSQANSIQIQGEKYEQEYQPLVNATPLTDTTRPWFEFEEEIEFPEPIELGAGTGFFTTKASISESNSPIVLENDEGQLDISLVPIGFVRPEPQFQFVTFAATGPSLQLDSLGHVYYLYEDGMHMIEYRNVTGIVIDFQNPNPQHFDYRMNFQIHIDETDGTITYHFGEFRPGPNGEQQLANFLIASLVIFDFYDGNAEIFNRGLAEGDPNQPTFVEDDTEDIENFLSGIPESGTVYEFSFHETTSAAPTQRRDATPFIYPNPGSDHLVLEGLDGEFTYELRTATGRWVQSGRGVNRTTIDATAWPTGMYFVSIRSGEESRSGIWIKQ